MHLYNLSQVFLLRQLTILLASTVGPDPSDDAVWSGYTMFALNHFCSNVWGRYAKLTLSFEYRAPDK